MREGSVFDLKLKQRMTRRQIDIVTFARVPTADNQPARIRIRFDFINQPGYLIDAVGLRIISAE